MLESIKQRLGRDDEQGFTLIELMVVVLIIAILLAIAIPTFLGAKDQANARGAQSSLRNALTAEQTQWTNNQAFGANTAMAAVEPNLNWVAAAPTSTNSPNDVFVTVVDNGNQLFLQSFGKDGNCYTVFQNNDPQVTLTLNGSGTGPNTSYDVSKTTCPGTTGTATTAATAPTNVVSTAKASSDTSGTKYYQSW